MTSHLFHLCTSRRWHEAIEFVRCHPQEAGKMLDTGKRGAAQVTALHVVLAHTKCRGEVPLALVKALLVAAPTMAKQKHRYTGNLPLHAVFYNAFFSASKRKQIAKMILQVYPDSLLVRNNDGRTPLHTTCSQHCHHEPIVALLEAAPETASWADNNGDLPLHLACRSQKSPNKSVQVLFEAYPEGIRKKNIDGLTPLEVTRRCTVSRQKGRARLTLLLKLSSRASTQEEPSLEQEPLLMEESETITSQMRCKRQRSDDDDDCVPVSNRKRFNKPSNANKGGIVQPALKIEGLCGAHSPTPSIDSMVDARQDIVANSMGTSDHFLDSTSRDDINCSMILVAMMKGRYAEDMDLEL